MGSSAFRQGCSGTVTMAPRLIPSGGVMEHLDEDLAARDGRLGGAGRRARGRARARPGGLWLWLRLRLALLRLFLLPPTGQEGGRGGAAVLSDLPSPACPAGGRGEPPVLRPALPPLPLRLPLVGGRRLWSLA